MLKRFIPSLATIILMILLGLAGNIRPQERVAEVRSPGEKHIHQVYKSNPMTVEFIARAQGLSKIAIAKQDSESFTHDDVIISMRNLTLNKTVSASQSITPAEIIIEFPPEAQSRGNRYQVDIIAPELAKERAFRLPYESDATKNPDVTVRQGEINKQGSLGITEYERPTIALMIARWLLLPHQRPLWLGVTLVIIGFILHKKTSQHTQKINIKPKSYQLKAKSFAYYFLIIASILIVYWPATKLFFYSDDVGILARISVLSEQSPFTIFTAHQYQDTDPTSQFGFDFWRPWSFSAYPLLLHLLFPTSASLYYFLNILFFAITGCLLFAIAKQIFRSSPAALAAVALWAFHSSKLGVIYWWSSIQDIFASLFAMLSIALYLLWRKKKGKAILYVGAAVYLLALLSKEYVIVTPFIIIALEGILRYQGKRKLPHKQAAWALSIYLITAGLFLVVNTAVLGDPTLPEKRAANQTYALTLNPQSIARNTVIYLAASAEHRLWPIGIATRSLEQKLDKTLQLWQAKTAGPYYPGIIVFGIFLASLAIFWRNKRLRALLLFSAFWWTAYMGPILLLANDWKPRWLTLAIFGLAIAIVTILKTIFPKIQHYIFYAICAVLAVYGYQMARDNNLTRFYKEQSAYTQEAYRQLKEQETPNILAKNIILVGITEEQETSLNAYLFRLYAKNPHADIIYKDDLPKQTQEGDIIINMAGIQPYYPESEK
ncbi:hypothetical protein A2837_00115 [Candidatus Kaiserbacteria bacterium RIFCSPHIGHO2_01_FULL_46_22]|uniref:Glycosyltransferase RgtA/B/C/D-like domain-containing protein n=1 Tax=Candidatus Kaiserbacteria bacterium RIFCSPHIGHO2_01_FULL_46_22 TaxID=1798475 RepID=A0A1F6BXL8_9BACT|nr:MAG: hypothetical protein A2837_00115 [Candidatus Kaiserbacteria bacterium RIFCSPHIGHO2_01_FULL_46_22]